MMSVPPEPSIPRPLRIWRGLRDPIGFLTYCEGFGDIVTLRRGRTYALFNPDYIKHVLQDNAKAYEKGEKYRALLCPIMGNGLFTSEGPFWLRQRRLAQGAFHRTQMDGFAGIIRDYAAELVGTWALRAARGEMVNLRRDLVFATLRMTLRNLFHVEPDTSALVPAVIELTEQVHAGSAFVPIRLPSWVSKPSRRRFARAIGIVDEFVFDVIARHKTMRDRGTDLLTLLMDARDEDTGERMSERQLRDELVTMVIAGHDTVTDAVVWTLVLLAERPELVARLRAEIQREGGAAALTVGSIKGLDLLGRVVHESMRLYPPAWVFARSALADDEIGGYRIPAGSVVVISPYVMHRSRRYWDDPLRFDPDRFLPERSAGRPRFAYFPFGGGQRQCIGQGMAMIELPVILAAIVERFDLAIPNLPSIRPSPRISLRPNTTVWLRLTPAGAAHTSADAV